jgi:hypothetical protein
LTSAIPNKAFFPIDIKNIRLPFSKLMDGFLVGKKQGSMVVF